MSDVNTVRTALATLAVVLLAAGAAHAQETLDVRSTVQKEETVVSDTGESETRLVPAERVVPGDKVVYTTTFTNRGDAPADNVVITNPIDESLTYIAGSVFGAGMTIEFSADGGQTFGPAATLTVSDENAERAAAPADYTHIRWTLDGDLEAGATGVARFSATVN